MLYLKPDGLALSYSDILIELLVNLTMKKAIAYIRISTSDQSNFSLTGQENYIRDFAQKNGYEILELFKDDGQSAKNFDRPDWKLLQKFCKENHHQVDALIVSKYDRFSRNLGEALQMIEMLEGKYKIRVLSAMEPIGLHPNSPYFFQFRTQMLMGAQVEWLVIKDRTRHGINTGQKAGRYMTTAPFGYINQRDESNKPIIVVDHAKAGIVIRMYQMLLEGAPLKEIALEARRKGYKNRSNSAVKFTLQCPTYAGLIRVSPYNDEPGYLIRGKHEPIIDESIWRKVQDIFKEEESPTRTVMNEEVPLRAVLKCICGCKLTAGKSRGKNKLYWYYKCAKHTKKNYPAIRLHDQMDEILKILSLPDHYIAYMKEKINELINEQRGTQAQMLTDKKKELTGLQIRLDNLEEKYINNDLDVTAYKKWRDRYQAEISICQKYIMDMSQPMDEYQSFFNENIHRLGNLYYHYHNSDLHTQQALVKQVFNFQLYYHDGMYRTPYIMPIFAHNALILKEKRLLEIEQPFEKSTKVLECAPNQTPIEHLIPLSNLLNLLKRA